MKFRARIYKVGINPCVKVPKAITKSMQPIKGYIPVNGTIDGHVFTQTLVPVKDEPYRLYVNGLMLKASGKRVGQTAEFFIEQDETPSSQKHPMPEYLSKRLQQHRLMETFEKLTSYRQKEIIRYLDYLKTEAARERNILKVLDALRKR
jgi:hypothetical protein